VTATKTSGLWRMTRSPFLDDEGEGDWKEHALSEHDLDDSDKDDSDEDPDSDDEVVVATRKRNRLVRGSGSVKKLKIGPDSDNLL